MAQDSLSERANNPIVREAPCQPKVTLKADGTALPGHLVYNNSGTVAGNTSAGARDLYVMGVGVGQASIDTAYTSTYPVDCYQIVAGLESYVDEKANDGGTTANVTVLQPTTSAGMVNTYAESLAIDAGSTTATSTAATAPVSGIYQPAHLCVALETRANDASNDQWVHARWLW